MSRTVSNKLTEEKADENPFVEFHLKISVSKVKYDLFRLKVASKTGMLASVGDGRST